MYKVVTTSLKALCVVVVPSQEISYHEPHCSANERLTPLPPSVKKQLKWPVFGMGTVP